MNCEVHRELRVQLNRIASRESRQKKRKATTAAAAAVANTQKNNVEIIWKNKQNRCEIF